MDTHLGRRVTALPIVLLASLVFFFSSRASAQEGTAQLRGRVTDQQSASLPGVSVIVTNQDSGNFREAVSAVDGSWFMAALPPGRYQVAAQLEGFKKFMRRA